MLLLVQLSLALQCLNSQNNQVDWWGILKLPKSMPIGSIRGKSYAYFDKSTYTPTVQPLPINQTSALFNTLNQLNKYPQISYLLYKYSLHSDQNPLSSHNCGTCGHSKGILAYDTQSAILIVHSIPKFPQFSGNQSNLQIVYLDINQSQIIYGQNLFCVKLDLKQAFIIAGLMTINKPQVYYSRITQANSNITALKTLSQPFEQTSAVFQFISSSFSFLYFAKSRFDKVDIWYSIVAPNLNTGLKVESWGRPYQQSYCQDYEVVNIRHVSLGGVTWKDTQDHSKWAVANTGDYTCYGDLNMMTSQHQRGGGALCISDPDFHFLHESIIEDSDSCQ